MMQQGQVFELKARGAGARWAYRYRVGGRGSRRVQALQVAVQSVAGDVAALQVFTQKALQAGVFSMGVGLDRTQEVGGSSPPSSMKGLQMRILRFLK